LRDECLSEEDLDLRTMTDEELHACWDLWLLEAQAPNVARQTAATRGAAGDG
jgi:hypothetical protein